MNIVNLDLLKVFSSFLMCDLITEAFKIANLYHRFLLLPQIAPAHSLYFWHCPIFPTITS